MKEKAKASVKGSPLTGVPPGTLATPPQNSGKSKQAENKAESRTRLKKTSAQGKERNLSDEDRKEPGILVCLEGIPPNISGKRKGEHNAQTTRPRKKYGHKKVC